MSTTSELPWKGAAVKRQSLWCSIWGLQNINWVEVVDGSLISKDSKHPGYHICIIDTPVLQCLKYSMYDAHNKKIA